MLNDRGQATGDRMSKAIGRIKRQLAKGYTLDDNIADVEVVVAKVEYLQRAYETANATVHQADQARVFAEDRAEKAEAEALDLRASRERLAADLADERTEVERLQAESEGWLTIVVAVRDILEAPSAAEAKIVGLNAIIPTRDRLEGNSDE